MKILEEILLALLEVTEQEAPRTHDKILDKLFEAAVWHEADAHDMTTADVATDPFKPKDPVAMGINAVLMSATPAPKKSW